MQDVNLVFLKDYRIRKSGEVGFAIQIPKSWVKSQNLQNGDEISVYQTPAGELVIIPVGNKTVTPKSMQEPQDQASGLRDLVSRVTTVAVPAIHIEEKAAGE